MYRRIELHNHTTESDGKLTPAELARLAARHGFGALALTDHNTTSGHRKLLAAIRQEGLGLDFVPGVEITTYYGHILCLGVEMPVPWEDVDKTRADLLLVRAHRAGGIAGIAHPFCMTRPVVNGCAWDMRLNDPSLLDYLEVVNWGSFQADPGMRAVSWWQDLVLAGYSVAAVSGLDLHGERDLSGSFTTWFDADGKGTVMQQLARAVRRQRTVVTRGPLPLPERAGGLLRCRFAAEGPLPPAAPLLAEIVTARGKTAADWSDPSRPLEMPMPQTEGPLILKLYEQAGPERSLLAIAPPLVQDNAERDGNAG